MNNLKITDVSTILNDVFNGINGTDDNASVKVADNLSNIADVGAKITEGTDYETLFAKTFPVMVDKVKTTKFINRKFIGSAPPCAVSPDTFRGIVEIVRTDVGSYDVNHLFDVIDRDDNFTGTLSHFADLFGKELPTINAKYYTMSKSYRQKITKTTDQFISAFASADAMMDFFASIESALAIKYDFAVDMLQYLTFDSAVVEKVSTLGTESALTNSGALTKSAVASTDAYTVDNCTKIINEMKYSIRRYKKFSKYGGADLLNSYSDEDIHIAILSDLYDAIITNKAFVMNDEFFGIPLTNVHPVVSFTPIEATKSVNQSITGKAHNNKTVTVGGILYVIYTTQSFACTVVDKKITHQYVADEDYTNVFHNAVVSNVINTDFPLTVGCTSDATISITDPNET